MKLFKNLFSTLNRNHVRYMVVGGIAVNLYGIERATADRDIVLDIENKNLMRFIEATKSLCLKPMVPVKIEDIIDPEKRRSWIVDKGMKVFSLYDPENSFFVLDIFVEMPFNFNEAYKQRKRMRFEDTIIPVVSVKDLIEMKKRAGRPHNRADVFYLEKILREWKDE